MSAIGLGTSRAYWAGQELAKELVEGATIAAARRTVRERCTVTDAHLDYIVEHHLVGSPTIQAALADEILSEADGAAIAARLRAARLREASS